MRAVNVFVSSRPVAQQPRENAFFEEDDLLNMRTQESSSSFSEAPRLAYAQKHNYKANARRDDNEKGKEDLVEEVQRMIEDLAAEDGAAKERAQRILDAEKEENERRAIEDEMRRLEEERERERQRLEELIRRMKMEKELEKVRLMKEKEERRRRVVQALRNVGRCVAGFEWIREGGGFRCAGGSHYASLADVAAHAGMSMEDLNSVQF